MKEISNSYQSEITVLIKRSMTRKISKYIGGCGWVSHVQEVSNTKIGEVDQFKIVIYHEEFKEYVCKQTGYDISQFIDKESL